MAFVYSVDERYSHGIRFYLLIGALNRAMGLTIHAKVSSFINDSTLHFLIGNPGTLYKIFMLFLICSKRNPRKTL